MTDAPREVGDILLELHRHCWRADAPPLELPLGDLVAVMPVLIRSGSVGLVWPRLRHRAEEYGAVGVALEHAYESQVEHNALVEQEIARVVSPLHGADVDPVLIKGLAMARLYPDGLIRTAGDIDLVVPDADYARATAMLSQTTDDFAGTSLHFHQDRAATSAWMAEASPSPSAVVTDLHGFSHWYGAVNEDFFADAQRVPLGGGEIHVPRMEDHVRALCLHFLRHGAVRPLRLCDIALLLETPAEDVDWERCLRGGGRQARAIMITLRLAQELLGADLEGAPEAVRGQRLPAWLMPAVIRQCEGARAMPRPFWEELDGDLRNIIPALRTRWPDPVSATVRTGAPFNEVPRLPIQLASYGQQMGLFVALMLRQQIDGLRN